MDVGVKTITASLKQYVSIMTTKNFFTIILADMYHKKKINK